MHLILHKVLPEIVRAGTSQTVGALLTSHLAVAGSTVLARLWVTRGDEELELLASAGTPSGGGSYARLDGHFREMAVSDHTIRRIAAAKEPLVVRGVRGDEDWLTNAGWAARQGVRSFVALPLVDGDDAVGVLAVFDRGRPDDLLIADLQLVAQIAAVRLAELESRAAPLPTHAASPTIAIATRSELRALEKANIEAALTRTSGKIFGADGAAALLGMRPTTLASRIKALGIR